MSNNGRVLSSSNVIGKVDWLQIIFQNISWEELFTTILGITLDSVSKKAGTLKHEEYDVIYSCGSIKYYTFDDETKSFYRGTLVMSGQACTMYEFANRSGNSPNNVFQELAWRIISNSIDTSCKFTVTRIDLALDDYNKPPYFTVDTIIRKVQKKSYYSRGRSDQVYDSEFTKKERAKTQQIGSGGSECLFRFYEKSKEMSKGLDPEKVEQIMSNAPLTRLEAEIRKDKADSLFQSIAYLPKDMPLSNLIRGFIKNEISFYSDSSCEKICRWWQEYLKPSIEPILRKSYDVSNFERTLNWYQYQGGLAVTQAIFFLIENGVDLDFNLTDFKQECRWSTEMVEKMIDFVSKENRTDLIPYIYEKQKY
ncbi:MULTISPECIES: replication initiation factor domain-containing protein [unclassified Enterococcus]|uniref:replication initiation factor domain-containing protein n=1 Tax=unclassified Enterococcus TaxID=2608891 RepID=UPI00190674C1|nr:MULTISPECIES: replication initiation factor domain-containing protein [unclassified Enterococcus]MBK0038001.1 replication initiation factor domain-containing protein [Enterococcus sp. S52]MBK0070676.1 replication initiation factor domain-containing protein [Enterococcus sp. S53]MBK0141327.1 replication initiation factor domain-containing protein [Enterococcus sp. S76]MBK0144715.1 replication initiation factor domain-containing protein [Enterococcus sp. S77]